MVGHEGGTGRNAFRCGALTLVTPDGRQFSCGSGMSDHDRMHPPTIDSVVTCHSCFEPALRALHDS